MSDSGNKHSDAEMRSYLRASLVMNVTEDILVMMEDADITKQELARRMGKSKSHISQLLSGARNMTLGVFSDICFALNVKPKVVLRASEAPKAADSRQWESIKKDPPEEVAGWVNAIPSVALRVVAPNGDCLPLRRFSNVPKWKNAS